MTAPRFYCTADVPGGSYRGVTEWVECGMPIDVDEEVCPLHRDDDADYASDDDRWPSK